MPRYPCKRLPRRHQEHRALAVIDKDTAVIRMLWERQVLGQFCKLHNVLISICTPSWLWSGLVFVLFYHHQSNPVTCQQAVKFFMSTRRTSGPSYQSQSSAKLTAVRSCCGGCLVVCFFLFSLICSTIHSTCLCQAISRGSRCKISKDPNP